MTSIVPKDRTTTVTINCYDYMLMEFVPNTRAIFRVNLKADYIVIAVENVTLEGDDYKQWGTDDTFIDKYICAKLGLVLA
jgi:hypothetical protein